MRLLHAAGIALFVLLPSLLNADTTLLYRMEAKANPSLPAAFSQGFGAAFSAMGLSDRTVLIRDGKTRTKVGRLTMIADNPNGRVILLDTASSHFADMAASQFLEETTRILMQAPAAAGEVLASMKVDSSARLTGRTEQIHGIQAEEHEITFSLSASLGTGAPVSPIMKMIMQFWMSTPEETARNPAIREFIDSGAQALPGMNSSDAMLKAFSQFPALGASFSSLTKELSNRRSLRIRSHIQIFAPILATLAAQMPAPNGTPVNFDPNSPIAELTDELVELSTAAIADSMFQVPAGYTAAPVADLMAAMRLRAPVTSPPAGSAAVSPLTDVQGPVFAVGNGVSQPTWISKVAPRYSEEARAKKIQGNMSLSIVVGSDGKARDFEIVKSLERSLDLKAIEAVQNWVFNPGRKDGVPVNTRTVVELNFRLLDKPPARPSSLVQGVEVYGGNGVGQPSLVRKVDPQYTYAARERKIEGEVTLSVVVGTDGKPWNIEVTHSLDPGLDQKAIEAARQWVFRPGQKDGTPVNTRAVLEIQFRLLDKPPTQQ